MKATWFFTEQDVQDTFSEFKTNNELDNDQVDLEKTFDEAGQIIGFRLNKCDGNNIVTGYQETYGLYGDEFFPAHMSSDDGGLVYVKTESQLYE